jgi:hypothetical protein
MILRRLTENAASRFNWVMELSSASAKSLAMEIKNDLFSLLQMEDLELSKTRKGTKYKKFTSTEDIVSNFRKINHNKSKSKSPAAVEERKFFDDEVQANDISHEEHDYLEEEILQIKRVVEDNCHEFVMSQQMDQLNLMSNAIPFAAPPVAPVSTYASSSYPYSCNNAQQSSSFSFMPVSLTRNQLPVSNNYSEKRQLPPLFQPIPQKPLQDPPSHHNIRKRQFPKYSYTLIKKAVLQGKIFAKDPSEPILTKEQRLKIEQNRQNAIAKRRENYKNQRL